jgi:hypothetical protein
MATKFSEFLQSQKIDVRRVASASQQLEKLRPEDRAAKLKQRLAKSAEGGATEAAAGEKTKRRTGRPVTKQLLDRAVGGKALTGPAKTRLLRAVNRVLEQKKKEPVDLRKLF